MALPIVINGAITLVPGVYSTLTVQNSLPNPVPAGRSVAILGEAEEGLPGSEMDLTKNFFESFDDVKDFYKSGAIVDAARMLFNNQPSPVFGGAVQRLYVYKTNNSTRAEKTISSPANYGKILASRYGEAGNQIKSQIKTGQAESKPSLTFAYLPSPASKTFRVSVNGVVTGSLALSAGETAADFVTALSAVTGLSTTGGTARTTVVSGPMTANLTASGDVLTITRSTGSATFSTSIQTGDSLYIEAGTAVAGTGDANAGAYIVTAVSATSISAKQIKHHDGSNEVNAVAFDAATGVSIAAADLIINAPVTSTITATTAPGASATLEILCTDSSSKAGVGMLYRDSSFTDILTDSTSSVANISATVPASGQLTVTLDAGSWSTIPKAGDTIRIPRGSAVAATNSNVGLYIVQSASAKSITMTRAFSGETTSAVSSTSLNGSNDALKYQVGFQTTSISARRIDSSAERKVKVEASRISDGAQFPTTLIGGNPTLEISYWNASATAAEISIDSQRRMTITPTGSGLNATTINTKKYATLQDLVNFLNSVSGVSARVTNPLFNSLPTSCLDMVTSVGCLSASSLPDYNARLKRDYYDWTQFFANNTSLLAFQAGSMSLKVDLPAEESVAGFLSGASLGSTSTASVQAGLDECLKIAVRNVIPLFSRDAVYDIADGLTDENSSYSIDSIHASVKAHVSTASSALFRKERFGLVSYDGNMDDTKNKAADLSYERMQMAFQRHQAQDGEGNLTRHLPWIAACAVAAGRSQAVTGTSMLRKPFLLSSAEHSGLDSLFDDTLTPDWSPENRQDLEDAINAGLMCFREVPGFGVRMESPDLSTRSRVNDPKGWFYERVNVQFTLDEVLDACRSTLENFIGERTGDVPTAVVEQALKNTLSSFLVGSGNGSVLNAKVLSVISSGNQHKAKVQVTPAEALEAIVLDVEATRSI